MIEHYDIVYSINVQIYHEYIMILYHNHVNVGKTIINHPQITIDTWYVHHSQYFCGF